MAVALGTDAPRGCCRPLGDPANKPAIRSPDVAFVLRRHLPAPPSLPGTPWRRRIVPASGATQFSRAGRQGGPEPTPRAASGGASRPDATKAACESDSAAPSSRGVPPNGSVEASCARATSSMPESERNTACKKLRLLSPVAMYRFDRAGAGLLSARAARSPGQPKPKNHALVPCTSCLN